MDLLTNTGLINNNELLISYKEKEYEADKNVHFESRLIKFSQLDQLTKQYNYSLIKWKDGRRLESNFCSASGLIIDIDHTVTIEEAKEILSQKNLCYFLITTKSHSQSEHRFRIIIPCTRSFNSLNDYKTVIKDFTTSVFPGSDTSVTDGARFFFGSPDDAISCGNFNGQLFDPDLNAKESYGIKQISDAWDDNLIVETSDKSFVNAAEIYSKTPIVCPFHNDRNPSAFLDYSENSDNQYIHCSSCGKTYWKTIDPVVARDKKCTDFFSYSNSVYEAHLSKNKLIINNIGRDKFYIRTFTFSKEQQEEIFRHLVLTRHIHSLETNYLSNPDDSEISYRYTSDEECFEVSVPPVQPDIKDNDFIEHYLQEKFGIYKNFIKSWLAVYCFSNYKKLPDLILIGERGAGKNSFAEMVAGIYEPLSTFAKDITTRFNVFVEKKLLIIDESDDKGKPQYTTLKRLKGQNRLEIEKKYVNEYSIRNNLNVIILSNDKIPIHLDSDEKPDSEKNNQFFVYEMPKSHKHIKPEFTKDLLKRFGHYMNTELKSIYNKLDFSCRRYSIDVPITETERNLFNISKTDIQAEAERVVNKLVDFSVDPNFMWYKFVKRGVIPSSWFDDVLDRREKNNIIKELQRRGYLKPEKADKLMQIDGKRPLCYKLDSRWKEEIAKECTAEQSKTDKAKTGEVESPQPDLFAQTAA